MICSKCLINRDSDEFSIRDEIKNIRHKICKHCHSLYRKKHYLINKEKYIKKALKWNRKQGQILTKFLFNILSNSECVDCGEKDIVVLDFDHVNNKKLGIAEMYKNRYSLHAIEEEISKCVVRCANCHTRKTAKDIGYWKFRILDEGT